MAGYEGWVFWTVWNTSVLLTVVGVRGIVLTVSCTLTGITVLVSSVILVGLCLSLLGSHGVVRILTAIVGIRVGSSSTVRVRVLTGVLLTVTSLTAPL